jgi:hypothetical protein
MSLFKKSDGSTSLTGKTEYVGGGKIPDGTKVLFRIAEIGWTEASKGHYAGKPAFLDLKLDILHPEQFNKRKMFQKLHVNDPSNKNMDKHIEMFGVLCAVSGEDMTPFTEDESRLDDLELSRIFVGLQLAGTVGLFNNINYVQSWGAVKEGEESSAPADEPLF